MIGQLPRFLLLLPFLLATHLGCSRPPQPEPVHTPSTKGSGGDKTADSRDQTKPQADSEGSEPLDSKSQAPSPTKEETTSDWVATWTASPQLTESRNEPPSPGLANNTLRQFIYVSLGGDRLKVRISNEFGNGPVTIRAAHLARAEDSRSTVDLDTDAALSFHGSPSVTISPGQAVSSDPFEFPLPPQSTVAVTMHFGPVPDAITGHPGSRTTSYLAVGDAVSQESLSGSVTTDHWYYLTGLDVMAPSQAQTVVALGNSLTDGRGSTTNGNDRWPDALSRRLRNHPTTAHVAVVNAGIGGNAVVSGGLGPTALERFERDVLDQAGVAWVIVLEGINDIGNSRGRSVAAQLIAAYKQIIREAHAQDVLVYGIPLLPFGGSHYDSPAHEQDRQKVNQWIRESDHFDAVIDLEPVVADPDHPNRLRPAYDTGDHLHLNAAGYQAMADAIELSLFRSSK